MIMPHACIALRLRARLCRFATATTEGVVNGAAGVEERKVRRLTAGERWIRTFGPPQIRSRIRATSSAPHDGWPIAVSQPGTESSEAISLHGESDANLTSSITTLRGVRRLILHQYGRSEVFVQRFRRLAPGQRPKWRLLASADSARRRSRLGCTGCCLTHRLDIKRAGES